MDINGDLDEREVPFIENDSHEIKRPLNMTVPERIVLSAGYDGDDNEDEESQTSGQYLFDDQPLHPPDVLMGGMHTPPSTLTIDDSDTTYARSRTQDGDGSATSHPQFQTISMLQKQYQDGEDSDEESRLSSAGRFDKDRERMAVVGREDEQWVVNSQMSLSQLQRRVRMLENELIDTQRSQSVWKMVLLAMTIINPFLINYFMRRR